MSRRARTAHRPQSIYVVYDPEYRRSSTTWDSIDLSGKQPCVFGRRHVCRRLSWPGMHRLWYFLCRFAGFPHRRRGWSLTRTTFGREQYSQFGEVIGRSRSVTQRAVREYACFAEQLRDKTTDKLSSSFLYVFIYITESLFVRF